jgi:hypothetical protein
MEDEDGGRRPRSGRRRSLDGGGGRRGSDSGSCVMPENKPRGRATTTPSVYCWCLDNRSSAVLLLLNVIMMVR